MELLKRVPSHAAIPHKAYNFHADTERSFKLLLVIFGNWPDLFVLAASERSRNSGRLQPGQHEEALVDLAVKLNVLAVCAAFTFIGAVLLGAF